MNYQSFIDTASCIGAYNEDRFFTIYERARRRHQFPPWLCDIARPPAAFDVRGVDAIAAIRRRSAPENLVHVPVQIKSSGSGVRKHFLHHPDHWRDGVVFVIVNDHKSDEAVRSQFEWELFQAWFFDWRYDAFWDHLGTELSPSERNLVQAIAFRKKRLRSAQNGSIG